MSLPELDRLGSLAGTGNEEQDPLGVLTRLRSRSENRPRPGEACEMCAEPIADEHAHVVNLDTRALLCSCRACYLLFTHEGAAGGRWRSVPDRYLSIPDFSLSAADWDALQIPVNLAFFFSNSITGETTAFYPSPAGATESLLPLGAWDELTAAYPALHDLQADVEAALIKMGETTACYVVPIDACYELVGLLRKSWRGFDGGAEARAATAAFFGRVQQRARPAPPRHA